MIPSAESSLARIRAQLEEFRLLVADRDFDRSSPQSAWSVAQHVDHCMNAMKFGLGRIREPKPPSRGKTWIGQIILRIGWIPRGKGKSPAAVVGVQRSIDEIGQAIAEVEQQVGSLPHAALADTETRVMKHPYFGGLTAAETLRFFAIHNHHHLKIIRDIRGE